MKRFNNDAFYASYYQKIMRGGVIGNVVNRYHQELELPFRSTDFFSSVIELGAGSCEHLPFVKHRFDSYILSDIRTKNLLESASEIINSEIQLDTPTYVSHYGTCRTVFPILARAKKLFDFN